MAQSLLLLFSICTSQPNESLLLIFTVHYFNKPQHLVLAYIHTQPVVCNPVRLEINGFIKYMLYRKIHCVPLTVKYARTDNDALHVSNENWNDWFFFAVLFNVPTTNGLRIYTIKCNISICRRSIVNMKYDNMRQVERYTEHSKRDSFLIAAAKNFNGIIIV
jgi:hypothetical protein